MRIIKNISHVYLVIIMRNLEIIFTELHGNIKFKLQHIGNIRNYDILK